MDYIMLKKVLFKIIQGITRILTFKIFIQRNQDLIKHSTNSSTIASRIAIVHDYIILVNIIVIVDKTVA